MKKEIDFLNKLKKNESNYYNKNIYEYALEFINQYPQVIQTAQNNLQEHILYDQRMGTYQWTITGTGGHTLTINNIEGLNNEETINEDDEIPF